MTTPPAIFLLIGPSAKSRAIPALPLSALTPCNGAAEARAAQGGVVADLGPQDHLAVQCSSTLILRRPKLKCRLSVVMYEPPAVQPRHYLAMRVFGSRFHRVLTYTPSLLRLKNAREYNMHMAWVTPTPAPEKTRLISLISSQKRDLPGHRLRLKIAEKHQDRLDLFGRAFKPLETKNDGLDPYRFSVAVENSRSDGYISEKVLDCFLTKTVPIYWGARDIGRYFNLDGVIVCEDEAALSRAVETVTEADYDARVQAVEENYTRALHTSDIKARLVDALST